MPERQSKSSVSRKNKEATNKTQAIVKNKTKAPHSTSFWTNKRRALVACAAILLILIIWFPLGGFTVGTHNGMESYLEDKYGKNFTVERPRYTDSGLGVKGIWRADAYPSDNKKLTFEVTQDESDGKVYSDGYAGAVWTQEETPKVKTFIENTFTNTPEYHVNIHTVTVGPDSIRGEVPNFSAAVARHGDEIYYEIRIKISSDELTESERQYHRDQVKKIATYVEQKGIASPAVYYVVNLNNEDARYICALYKEALINDDRLNKCFDTKSRGRA